jgi:hypothetical protein
MTKDHWKIDDLSWGSFDLRRLDPEMLRLVKTASMVEYGAHKYEQYLNNVFANDPIFKRAVKYWAEEEIQHGATLGRYAELADPSFSFAESYWRYDAGYSIDINANKSPRGSCAAELVSRCMVEIGTSSYYTALGRATEEPLLKEICHHIAGDELKHYAMFFSHLKGYVEHEKMGRLTRLKIALGRVRESSDDELAFAYFAANTRADAVYDRKGYARIYLLNAFPNYRRQDVDHMVAMTLKASGFRAHAFLHSLVCWGAWGMMQREIRKAAAPSTRG